MTFCYCFADSYKAQEDSPSRSGGSIFYFLKEGMRDNHVVHSLFYFKDQTGHTYVSEGSEPKLTTDDYSRFCERLRVAAVPTVGIWIDDQEKKVVVARDAFGLVPIYYLYQPGKFILFSTSLKDIRLHPLSSAYTRANYETIWSYLSLASVNGSYDSGTFFQAVQLVLPGTLVEFSSNNHQVTRYLELNRSRWAHLSSLQEYGEEFKFRFGESINRCLNQASKAGSLLSGGLDSSSIVSLLRFLHPRLPATGYFIDTDLHDHTKPDYRRDSYYCQKIVEHTGIALNTCVLPPRDTADLTVDYIRSFFYPLEILSVSSSFTLLDAAKRDGCEVLFTGHGGDSIVGFGLEYLDSLWADSDWAGLSAGFGRLVIQDAYRPLREKIGKERLMNNLLSDFVLQKAGQDLRAGNLLGGIEDVCDAWKHLGLSSAVLSRKILKRIKKKVGNGRAGTLRSARRPLEGERSNVSFSSLIRDLPLAERDGYLDLFVNQNILGLDDYYALANKHGLTVVHPYFDRDLYELSLSIPLEWLFDNGRGRGHMREGLRGIMPESVRCRTNKGEGSPRIAETARDAADVFGDYLNDSSEVWRFVDKDIFFKNLSALKSPNLKGSEAFRVAFETHRTTFLAIWLYECQVTT